MLQTTDVTRVLGGRRVLDELSLTVPEHGRVGIVGRSGAGKSTLLSIVAGLDTPDAGSISVGLADCALMPQRDCLLPWRTALDNACLALENRGVPRAKARERALPLFARLGLAGSEELLPAKLSGGMRQRVAFARTLLADEPRTVLLVTHDVEEALLLCDRVLVLAGGRIAADFDVDVPRLRTDIAFVELRERALEAIA